MNRKHLLMMVVCCALPLVAIAVLPLFGVALKGGLILLLATMLCPLSHLLMMRGMHDEDAHEGHAGHHEGQTRPGKVQEGVAGRTAKN